MSEAPRTPTEVQAGWLAENPDATLDAVLAAGPAPLALLQRDYPDRLAALQAAHGEWVRQGRPAAVRPTAPPVVRPAPVPIAPVEAPSPEQVPSMKALVAMGASRFTAFRQKHPDDFDRLRAGAGLPAPRR